MIRLNPLRILSCAGFLALAVVTLQTPAYAQTIEFNLNELGQGQALLNVSATESQSVDQDELVASLQYTKEGTDQTALQDDVNKVLTKALDIAKKSETVDVATDQYYVYMIRDNGDKRITQQTVWRAQQGLSLTSKDSEALLELAGELQGTGLHITNLRYTLSPEKYEQTTDSMLKDALTKLQNRAKEAATALGKSEAQLIEINVDGGPQGQPYFAARSEMSMMAMDSSQKVATPVATPGKTDVSITVSARALLMP